MEHTPHAKRFFINNGSSHCAYHADRTKRADKADRRKRETDNTAYKTCRRHAVFLNFTRLYAEYDAKDRKDQCKIADNGNKRTDDTENSANKTIRP